MRTIYLHMVKNGMITQIIARAKDKHMSKHPNIKFNTKRYAN